MNKNYSNDKIFQIQGLFQRMMFARKRNLFFKRQGGDILPHVVDS